VASVTAIDVARVSARVGVPAYSAVAWGYIGLIVLLGASLEAALLRGGVALDAISSGLPSTFFTLALFLLATLAGLFPVKLGRAQKINLGTAAVFAAVLLLPAAVPGLISAGAAICYSCALRRPWFNVLFTAGQHAVVAGAAAVAYGVVWSPARPPLVDALAAASVVAAAFAYVATSTLVVSGVVAATQGRGLVDCLLNLLGQSGTQYLALIALGALAAVCVWFAPWAIALVVLGLPLVQQLNRSVEQAVTAKEQVELMLVRQRCFVSDIAHEIGTPLTTLSGNITVLQQGAADDPTELRETLQDLGAEFSRLSGIFTHLMLLAEADERDQIVRRPVCLELLVGELGTIWRERVSQSGLTLEIGRVDPAQVEGDEGRIRQMLGELLENARRYTPTGGSIVVELRRTGSVAQLVVTDNGVGISAEDLPHIFERFYRGQMTTLPARSRTTGGSGLGLSIVKWGAEIHGGRVLVDSAPGRGSIFTVEFPVNESRPS
jgi:signal transduction histidine kinase